MAVIWQIVMIHNPNSCRKPFLANLGNRANHDKVKCRRPFLNFKSNSSKDSGATEGVNHMARVGSIAPTQQPESMRGMIYQNFKEKVVFK